MNRCGASICAAVGTALLLDGTAAFALHRDAESQVLAQERKYTAGILHGDIALLNSVWADSFVDTDGNAVLRDKASMLALLAKSTPPTQIIESNQAISVYGTTAVVTVEFRVNGMDAGKPYATTGRATDVWVLQSGVWRCVAAHSSEVKGAGASKAYRADPTAPPHPRAAHS